MFWKSFRIGLFTTMLLGCVGVNAVAQTQLTVTREIRLPVHSYRSMFGGKFWTVGMSADELFQFKIMPDQSLLILYPNASGKWPLIRLRKWWTAAPTMEELDLPGWTEADSSDLLVTPDGNYAVASGGVASVKSATNIPFPPNESIEHRPDLLIIAIDLNRWRIVAAFHTATADPDAKFRGAYILNGRWIALQGLDNEPERFKYEHVYDRVNRLISIPALRPGPGCMVHGREVWTSTSTNGQKKWVWLKRDDPECADLLIAAGVPSIHALEWLIYAGHDPEPKSLMVHGSPSIYGDQRELGNSQELDAPDGEYNPGYWTSNEWNIYFKNPPFESSARGWYQLRWLPRQSQKPQYYLTEYTFDGQLLREHHVGLVSNPQCSTRWGCDCTIADISEQHGAILALCRVQSLDFAAAFKWHKQWLTIIRSTDFSQIDLSI